MLGEKIAKEDYERHGYSVISTRIGSDFIAYKKIGVKLYQEYVEVKTGSARQSAVQRKKMKLVKRMGISYNIYRITEKFLVHYLAEQIQKTPKQLCGKEKLYSMVGDR